jgi:hypothetical protein
VGNSGACRRLGRLRVGNAWDDRKYQHFENISISPTPSGAEATITGLDVPTACVTPYAVTAKRNADISVALAKPAYQPQVVKLTKDVPGAGAAGFAGNILAGGLIGMGVDAYNGAAQDYKPNPVIVTLRPNGTHASPRAAGPRVKPAKPAPEVGT